MSEEIRVGDKVIVIDSSGAAQSKVGDELIVESSHELAFGTGTLLKFKDKGYELFSYRVKKVEAEVKVIPFKVGDEVVVVKTGCVNWPNTQTMEAEDWLLQEGLSMGSVGEVDIINDKGDAIVLKGHSLEHPYTKFALADTKERHPRADMIHLWAEDTSLEFEQSVEGKAIWNPMLDSRVLLDPRWTLDIRVKPPQTAAEVEKEVILASIKEVEEKLTTELIELHKRLKKLEV
jgi:hypothetical protein